MIGFQEAKMIADKWINEYSIIKDASPVRPREAFFVLDDMIYRNPEDAIEVFYAVSQMEISENSLVGLSVGPIRTFLMLYGDMYKEKIDNIVQISNQFREMYALAVDGLD